MSLSYKNIKFIKLNKYKKCVLNISKLYYFNKKIIEDPKIDNSTKNKQ